MSNISNSFFRELKPGDRVYYIGSSQEQIDYRNSADPREILDFTTIYEVENLRRFPYHTYVKLVGIAEDRFNSVVFEIESTEDKIVPYRENGKWGYKYRITQEVVIPPTYDEIDFDSRLTKVRMGNKWELISIDTTGKVV